jgi:hypothetical protein
LPFSIPQIESWKRERKKRKKSKKKEKVEKEKKMEKVSHREGWVLFHFQIFASHATTYSFHQQLKLTFPKQIS